MSPIALSAVDLALAASLVLVLALLNLLLRLGLTVRLLHYSLRMTVQLLAIGLVLKLLFAQTNPWFVVLLTFIMLSIAGMEVRAVQSVKIVGFAGYGIGTISMFVSSFSLTLLALLVIIQVEPWYTPQYVIPLLGMMLGNTMNGVALATDKLTSQLYEKREIVEQRLMLGQTWKEASLEIQKESMKVGMIPTINSMGAAGIVSLPGMMTGQILAGTSPLEAVNYQILIMFLITAGTGFGVICAILLLSRHMFDRRHRLRLDRVAL